MKGTKWKCCLWKSCWNVSNITKNEEYQSLRHAQKFGAQREVKASECVHEESPILDHVFMGGQRDRITPPMNSIDGGNHFLRPHELTSGGKILSRKPRKYKKMLPETEEAEKVVGGQRRVNGGGGGGERERERGVRVRNDKRIVWC